MKNLKTFLVVLLSGMAVYAFGAEYPFGTKTYNGGRVEPVSLDMIASTNEHMNFCFAHMFSDGLIYMYHSEGVHTVTERAEYIYSADKGKTWQKMPNAFSMLNVFENKAGKKCNVSCWDKNVTDTHTFLISTLDGDLTQKATTSSVQVKLPFKASVYLHRDALRLKDGTLLINGYGMKEGESKHTCYVFASHDDGQTWEFLSTFLDNSKKDYQEGANEAVMIQLANGDILGYVRTGKTGLVQRRSTDGGKTWGDPKVISPIGVSPDALVLADGTIVVTSGRPKLDILVDFTGNGENYHTYRVWDSCGSSYATMLETAPNEVTLIYDESDFGAWRQPSPFSRIMSAKFKIVKDDALKFDDSMHPMAKKYQFFYTPFANQYPDSNGFVPYCLLKKNERTVANGTYWDIKNIAERPHPVLHLEFRGKDAPHKFSHFFANIDKTIEYAEIEVGWELRLRDMVSKDGQFRVILRSCKNNVMTYVDCAKDKLIFFDNGKVTPIPYDMADSRFHAFRFKLNANDGTFALYKEGESKPLHSGKAAKSGTGNLIFAGDGSSSIFGAVELSYFGYNLKH